ncbi:tigger transposable element-derived protein 6-like [Mercenaria mercenaria]|uniref:tigger transposable element-derived protein 6-like n=1 Tax=Mercenaria mercenaria TaxID=6596 RepID=UPI00234F9DDC|nr:tigger transposable element-derived protein 6-like [Mercenaria mercenaria]
MPVSGPIIKEKALHFANELEISEFKASNGWLDKWKDRHSIKEFKVSIESAGVDQNVVENFKSRIPEVVGDYSLDDVFNCDETGLYYRTLPDKTLSVKVLSDRLLKVRRTYCIRYKSKANEKHVCFEPAGIFYYLQV